jgi:hypothetical protein
MKALVFSATGAGAARAVAADEIAHRPSDFSRRIVIGFHIPGLDPPPVRSLPPAWN